MFNIGSGGQGFYYIHNEINFIVSINSEIQNKFLHLTKLWFRVGVITV